ncbi:aspartic peptidase domain-containing protein [Clohesyomyces aquaticus]|uniref:Aspartic peptidase domain-containing protein n=1 Tax=Clohesyomyces aquaticus TaxID=1231657 RepID=A0A1Y1YNQ8_9PLEO|nr:aspartic peptidase domain-containing protein [Clohesyomyces aquaticus]
MSNNTGNSSARPLVVENSGRWLGNDGAWSTFYVHVGTPPQHFHVVPSTKGQTIYVPIDQDCQRMNISACGASRGVEVFDQRPSDGFQINRSSTWNEIGIYRLGLDASLGLSGNGEFGYDTVGPSTAGSKETPVLNHQAVSAFATPDFWLGQLGLWMFAINMSETNQPHSFLSSLKEQGHIPSLSFGYNAGTPYRFTKISGSLTLGGYDRSRISNGTKATLQMPISEDLLVGLQNISVDLGNGTTTILDQGILSVIDSTIPELWLPRAACDKLASSFGLTYFEPADRYALTNDAHDALQKLSPTLSLTLGAAVKGGDTIIIDIPYAAFDLQANYPIFANSTNYFPIRRAANDSQYTIGRVFLQEAYLTVDWERNKFNISKAYFSSPMPDADLVAIPPLEDKNGTLILTNSPKGKKLSAGAIAGIAIGVLLLLLLIGALVWWFKFRKPPPQEEKPAIEHSDDKKPGPDEVRPDDTKVGPEASQSPKGILAELGAPHGNSEMLELLRSVRVPETYEIGGNEPIEVEGNVPIEVEGNVPAEVEGIVPVEVEANVPIEVEGSSPIYELSSP